MNDLMTDSFVAAAAKAQQGSAPASSAGGDAPELRAFLAEADAAKADMAALRDELSRLRAAHEASRHAVVVGSGGGRAATQAALVRLLGSARRLRARLASMDRRAPAPAAQAAAGLRGRVHDLTADVQALRCQVSAERREDAARRYLTVAGDAPTEEQLDRLLANTDDSDAAMRAALLSAAPAAQLFLDMAALVEAQGAPLDDIERHVAAAAGDVGAAEAELREARRLQGEARRRRVCLAGGIAALLLVAVAVAVVAALVLARRGGGGGKLVLQIAADFPAR
ncbi:syntaxin-121 [Setaria italica]|uniref:syntaxin-121 n=1 Tax=Setaria italica TaxID=4555 RepID=UPI00064611C4|nr:syntaxin-121 [Setaria italica]